MATGDKLVTLDGMKALKDALYTEPAIFEIAPAQWSGSSGDWYFTVSASNVTEDSILIPQYDVDSAALLNGPIWCVPDDEEFTIHTTAIPGGTVTIMILFPGTMGVAQVQVLPDAYTKDQVDDMFDDVYTKSEVYTKTETNSAISQSMAKVSNIAFFSETTWSQIYAKLKAGLNDSDGRSIALFTVYAGAISNILTANNFSGYLKGYVTMSGSGSNLYDFFAGALSTGDMFAWRVTASDSAPTISNFRRFVVYSGENGWTNHALSNTSILTYAASVADPSFTTFRTNNTVTGGPVNNEYYFGDVTRYGQNIAIRMSKMGDPTILYMNHSTNNGSTWTGWKKFTGTAV